jgi:hypothetical protein
MVFEWKTSRGGEENAPDNGLAFRAEKTVACTLL